MRADLVLLGVQVGFPVVGLVDQGVVVFRPDDE